jgi:RNA polymerase sigma-70 factor (ECF subfamily)
VTALLDPTHDLDALLALANAGDADAFDALARRYRPVVYRWAVALCGDPDDADDVVQETLVRLHDALPTYRGDGSFDAWLYRITRRLVLRGRRRRTGLVRVESPPEPVYETDPGSRVDRVRAAALVHEVAATLPMRQREIFVLCDLDGRTPAEVARLLDMNDATVRANLFKARAAVRRDVLRTHPSYRELDR